jgi:hypothetical protein
MVGILQPNAKYNIPHLRRNREATSNLFTDYPIILAIWDQQQTAFQPTFSPPFIVLNATPSMNILQILPAVFSDCSTQALL